MRGPITDVGLETLRPETLERLGPVVQAIIEGVRRSLATIVDSLPEDEQVFVLRSVRLSLFVQHLAREPAAMREHLLAQIPRLVEVERALAERGGRAVS